MEFQALIISLMALMKIEYQEKKKEIIIFDTSCTKKQSTSISWEAMHINAGHLNLNKICFLPSGVHSPM